MFKTFIGHLHAFWEHTVQFLSPLFHWVAVSLLFSVLGSLYVLDIVSSIRCPAGKDFLPSCRLSLHSINRFLCSTKAFNLIYWLLALFPGQLRSYSELPSRTYFKTLHVLLLYVSWCVCVHGHECHLRHVEVRGQLLWSWFSLRIKLRSPTLCGQAPLPLSHLTSPDS